ncbi:MAG: Mur ligase family protein [Sulfurimonadaceae bacterium]|jgi:dihydrofolate synthase/folylpolyglutamate synthase|nr:Mur ligase family protein [Sulfurimonadaceae bacterium]
MLKQYLDTKPLYYDVIDYTRMPRVYKKLQPYLSTPKIIHLIGTNGKGTTGRFLATALFNRGYGVGHYTSPHILKFNERIWLDGVDVRDEVLEKAHIHLQTLLTKEESESLSYFEYTTLLAMVVYAKCEYVVLEAGLGGEHDATAVFPKTLTLITPIDFDHQSFLGNSIEEIAQTKINAMQTHAILAEQKYKEVYEVAQKIANQKGGEIFRIDTLLKPEKKDKITTISINLALPNYLVQNLKLAIAALEFLEIDWESKDFNNARLFGRLSQIEENIYLDVGHNPLAATSIAESLKDKKVILVYNSYKDKDYKAILTILRPILLSVEIIAIEDKRIVARNLLQEALEELGISYKSFDGTLQKEYTYLVFGSFSVAEQFLKNR